MNKAVLGLICVFLTVASAQTDCMQALEVSLPNIQKMYTDAIAQDWVAFEADFEKLVPSVKLILATCANYNISADPIVDICIKDVESIAKLVMPVIMNPQDVSALYTLLFKLPGALSTFYGQCLNPAEIKDDMDYVQVLIDQKIIEGNIYNCISSVIAVLPTLKKIAADIITQADIQVIQDDLAQLGDKVYNVCDNCGIPRPAQVFKATDVEQCMARVMDLYQVLETIIKANYNIPIIIDGVRKLIVLLPATLTDCGIQI